MTFKADNFPPGRARHGGLTLIEMVVAVGLLVVVILGVSVVFQSATSAVGISQRMLDMLSNVRSVQRQIDSDVAGMDKNGFLAIRSATFNDANGNPHRCDMITFMAYGSFRHRTGRNDGSNPFTDTVTVSPSAVITWNQLVLQKTGAPAGYIVPNQGLKIPRSQMPNGIFTTPMGNLNDGGMILGRNVLLLAPQNAALSAQGITPTGSSICCYKDTTTILAIDYSTAAQSGIQAAGTLTESSPADITQSRVDLAATTPSNIMSFLRQTIGSTRSAMRYEAEHFCFRHATLVSPYDSELNLLTNGYFRMHPIALQGVSSFAVDWTDGQATYVPGDTDLATGQPIPSTTPDGSAPDPRIGSTKWYGMNYPKNATYTAGNAIETGSDPSGDSYSVIFSFDTKSTNWPKSLRFRYHVSDPSGRLVGGRDFVQIVKLPD